MAERSKLTLEALRQLAREHLGAGYSRLTRSQLVEALRRVVPKLVEGEGETPGKPARGAGKRVTATDVEREADQLREASLRKKADAKKTEPGARPVTARRVPEKKAEKEKPLSRGVARVKSAIATIAKEVEARRHAAKPAEKKPAEKPAEKVARKAPKVEAPKVEARKVEAPKVEVPKVEAPKVEAPKVEAPKVEAPKVEAPKVEAPKVEAPKVEARKAEARKAEAPKVEAPKVEAPKVEAPKVEARKAEAPKVEAPKAEAQRKPEPAAAPEAEQPPQPAPRERPKVIARSTIERAPEVMAAWLRTEREVRAQRAEAEGQREEAARPFPAEPVVEGFFVARVAGRGEARRHHLTDDYATGAEAGARPSTPYGGRRIFLLPRDPATLFIYWDALAAGIELAAGERLVVRILRGGEPVREIPAEELARGYYVEGLTPGATYRAEAFAVGPDGERAVDASGLPVALPHIGEPADRVRFLRVPISAPLPHLREFLRSGHAQFVERAGTVLVTVPIRTWRESGGAWAFTLSGSGSGRWLREGAEEAVTEEIALREWEEAGQPRVEVPAGGGAPSSLSGAGRVSSPRSGWGRK